MSPFQPSKSLSGFKDTFQLGKKKDRVQYRARKSAAWDSCRQQTKRPGGLYLARGRKSPSLAASDQFHRMTLNCRMRVKPFSVHSTHCLVNLSHALPFNHFSHFLFQTKKKSHKHFGFSSLGMRSNLPNVPTPWHQLQIALCSSH